MMNMLETFFTPRIVFRDFFLHSNCFRDFSYFRPAWFIRLHIKSTLTYSGDIRFQLSKFVAMV